MKKCSVCCVSNATITLLLSLALLLGACGDDATLPTPADISMGQAAITLTGLNDDMNGMEVQLRNITTNSVFTQQTDQQGTAVFNVATGLYEASVSASRNDNGQAYIYNGTSGQLTVHKGQTVTASVAMKRAVISQLVIKELYCGGCMPDVGTTAFHYDKCIVLYNNSAMPASLSDLCFGMGAPANAQATNENYTADGRLNYEDEGFIPVWNGIWYFPETLTVEPYGQVVVNVHGAINNTRTVTNSVNYANPDYYCMYDPESGYRNSNYYPHPFEGIPTSHYLKAVVFAQGNAWPLSNSAPALVMFQTHGVTPADFARNTANYWYDGGGTSAIDRCVKVPNNWVVDAIEVFQKGTESHKRLTADIDAGYVILTNKQGHSLYRNVDREATEALPENAGKLVYDYALGVDDSTDPSGIDAEASMRQGAHIIYQNTNNSTTDFHERKQCSLR
jgi:hypothetical protein